MNNNNIYIYNDTFLKLLSLINFLIKNHIKPLNIKSKTYKGNLFDNIINLNIKEDPKLLSNIKTNLGNNILKIMYYVYLSSEEYKELYIYYFYLNSLKYGPKVIYKRNLKCVNLSLKISKYVSNEAHKLKGFVRFQELDNHFLYSVITPTNNVISLLASHFKKRLPNENWLIHDKKRGILCLSTKNKLYFINDEELKLNVKEKETADFYTDLWCTFYKTIAIKARKNERCRANFMPKKYWQNIIEMSMNK